MDVITFTWRAKYGHFLRAEANVNALTYPVPPRTAVLGLIAAVLGLEKDSLGEELGQALVAVSGVPPVTFWHRVKLRKDPPTPLSWRVKRAMKQRSKTKPEKAALHRQEWLWRPSFRVDISMPSRSDLFAELARRLEECRWYFTPCMGLSELLADLEWGGRRRAVMLPPGRHDIDSLCPEDQVRFLGGSGVAVRLLRMPYSVDRNRVFRHKGYYLEREGRPIPVETEFAYRVGERNVVFS